MSVDDDEIEELLERIREVAEPEQYQKITGAVAKILEVALDTLEHGP
jgi:hypothetical protein